MLESRHSVALRGKCFLKNVLVWSFVHKQQASQLHIKLYSRAVDLLLSTYLGCWCGLWPFYFYLPFQSSSFLYLLGRCCSHLPYASLQRLAYGSIEPIVSLCSDLQLGKLKGGAPWQASKTLGIQHHLSCHVETLLGKEKRRPTQACQLLDFPGFLGVLCFLSWLLT